MPDSVKQMDFAPGAFEFCTKIHDVDNVENYSNKTFWQDVRSRIWHKPVAMVSLFIILVIILFAVFAPMLSPYTYKEVHSEQTTLKPRVPGLEKLGIFDGGTEAVIKNGNVELVDAYSSRGLDDVYHYFGTDDLGRDIWTRTAVGTRISLFIAAVAVLIDVFIGVVFGMISGYFGGKVDMVMQRVIDERPPPDGYGILHHEEGVDLLPANIELSAFEVGLANVMSREYVLRETLEPLRERYDRILIDCMPSLGMMTINALAAADSVIIPSQPSYLSTNGLSLLMGSISKVRRQINPGLRIDGVLLTMVDNRTNNAKSIIASLRQTGDMLRVFDTEIPFSVRAAETSIEGKSIFAHDGRGKVAAAYEKLVKEVLEHEQRQSARSRSQERLR